MKKTATLLFMFVTAYATTAQAKTTETTGASPFPHFSNQQPNSVGPAINTRLVKKIHYKYAGTATPAIPNDEVLYEYYSGRGSNVDIYDQGDDDVQYDVSYSNAYLQGSVIQKKLRREQHYNLNNKVDMLSYSSWKSITYKDSIFYNYIYNSTFKDIIDEADLNIYSGTIINTVDYINSLDAQGNVYFMYGVNYFMEFTYANNRLLTQLDYHGSAAAPVYNELDSFIYDGTNRVTDIYSFKWDNGWKMDQLSQYDYSSNNDLNTITKKVWSGSVFNNNSQETFSYVNHNLVSDITDVWNSSTNNYDHAAKLTWTYNPNNQPTQLNTFSWQNNNWTTTSTDYQIVWEYQTYFPTAIYDVNNDVNTNLYPVPAQQSVNIALSWKKMQPFNIAITDVTGRTLTQWNENAVQEYHKNIPVNNIPSGNYFVVLTGKDGLRSAQKFQVAH